MKKYALKASAAKKMIIASSFLLFSGVFSNFGTQLYAFDTRLEGFGRFIGVAILPLFPLLCGLSLSKERKFARHFEPEMIKPVKLLKTVFQISVTLLIINWSIGVVARTFPVSALNTVSSIVLLIYSVFSFSTVSCVYMWVCFLSKEATKTQHVLSGASAATGTLYIAIKAALSVVSLIGGAQAAQLGVFALVSTIAGILCIVFYVLAIIAYVLAKKHFTVSAALEEEEKRRLQANDIHRRSGTYLADRERLFGIDNEDDEVARTLEGITENDGDDEQGLTEDNENSEITD